MSIFSIRNFYDSNGSQLSIIKEISINNELVFAEDLVILLAQQLTISPIGRHLFGLFHPKNKIWLSNNERLSEWTETKELEFRLRYDTNNLTKLKVIIHFILILFFIQFLSKQLVYYRRSQSFRY
jgi:hypothetical protein